MLPQIYVFLPLNIFSRTSTRLLNVSKKLSSFIIRKYSNVVKRELEVPPFCDVYINVPYNLKIKPLNIHKYHNCDKLIIQHNGKCEESLECNVDGNHVTILDKTKDTDILAQVKVPIKANLYVNSQKDITVGQINGDKINLKSVDGNITLDKFHGKSVKITTKNGDIKFKNVVQASKIHVIITENGSISTGRLQGQNLRLETNKGNITVDSSYCDESVFDVFSGNLDLSNVHKSCKISLTEGHLNLNGFDGKLSAQIEKGSANVYISRILENSEINIKNGSLQLKLSELCQEHAKFVVRSDSCDASEAFKYVRKEENGCVVINPEVSEEYVVDVNCSKGPVHIERATWHDMIKMKLKK